MTKTYRVPFLIVILPLRGGTRYIASAVAKDAELQKLLLCAAVYSAAAAKYPCPHYEHLPQRTCVSLRISTYPNRLGATWFLMSGPGFKIEPDLLERVVNAANGDMRQVGAEPESRA